MKKTEKKIGEKNKTKKQKNKIDKQFWKKS
jgi:hypothetical protein